MINWAAQRLVINHTRNISTMKAPRCNWVENFKEKNVTGRRNF